MSRTPGASCLMDVRTTAIMQDHVLSTNFCAPGADVALRRRRGGYLLENCQPPVCGYDRSRDMVSVLGAMFIVATVIGNLHTLPIFIPAAVIEYKAGYIEMCLINALTYLITLLTACLTNIVIGFAGHKLTALFGMTALFVGLLLDSQVFHISVLYISHLIFMGIGGGFAYSAAVTLPSDLFRDKITVGVLLVNIAGSLGTIFYTWLIVKTLTILGYKWTKLMMAFIALFFTLAINAFPKTRLMYDSNCEPVSKKTKNIRDCVTQYASETHTNECENQRNCLCVCICDLRLYRDKSFTLWSCLVMLAAMNFHVPYLYLVSFAESVGAQISAWYITIYCIASIIARANFIYNIDYTFAFNRTLFQICLIVSGLMWILINWASTYGWILIMCGILGAIEGTLAVITPRVAMGTIPLTWLSGAWVSSILFHAVGMFVASVFTAVIALRTFHYFVAFMTIGIIQIIVAIMAILLPDEDDEEGLDETATTTTTVNMNMNTNTNDPCAQYRTRLGSTTYDYTRTMHGGAKLHETRRYSGAAETGGKYANAVATGRYSISRGNATGTNPQPHRPDYKCNCPICSKIGCIPECLPDCSPAGTVGQC